MAENWWLIALVVLAIGVGIWWLAGKDDDARPVDDAHKDRTATSLAPAPPPSPIATTDAELAEPPPVVVGPAASPFDVAPPPIPAADVARTEPIASPADGPPDDLTVLKGVGPKLATTLGELGVTRYAQIAAWSDGDLDRIDDRLGAFKGRPVRDRWVEQAALLAAGDRKGFEERFGRLG